MTKNKVVRGKVKQATKKVTITTWLYDEVEAAGAFDKPDDKGDSDGFQARALVATPVVAYLVSYSLHNCLD